MHDYFFTFLCNDSLIMYMRYSIPFCKLVFSPAPTLLEMQQENLSKRLKSYKSLHGLSSQIELTKQPDSSLENGIL